MTRRSALALPALGLGRRRRPVAMYPDESGLAFFQEIIVGSGGVFVYSPVQGAGNLVASVAAAAGTDFYGNEFLKGITQYDPSGTIFGPSAVNLNAGALTFFTAPTQAGPYVQQYQFIQPPANVGQLTVSGTDTLGFAVPEIQLTGIDIVFPSGDLTGVTDRTRIQHAANPGGSVLLGAGTFYTDTVITVTGATLSGAADMGTVIKPGTGYAGPLLAVADKGVIRNLSVENSGSDAITVAGGVSEWWLMDLYFSNNAGSCINATITGPAHGRIRGIRGAGGGSANGGGIRIDGGTGGGVTAEVNIYDIDIQGCTASEVLFYSAVTDCPTDLVNGSVKAGVATNAITRQGACQTVHLDNIDVGGSSAGTGVLVDRAAGGFSPTDCRATGKLQDGAVGLVVNDGTARCLYDVECTRNRGDGAQFNGTGAFNKLLLVANQNNLAAGTAYDANITSTAHVLIDGPQWASPGVTANLNIALALNHVTVANPPASTTTAGNAPAGW